MSSVGNRNLYDGDQKTVPQSEIEQQKKDNRFHEGNENSHKANDSSEFLTYRPSLLSLLMCVRG
jgi:hypothetical protein